MSQAVEHLISSGELSHGDRQWRPYLVLRHTYVEGLSRQEATDRLIITRAVGDRERTGTLLTYLGMSLERMEQDYVLLMERADKAGEALRHCAGRSGTKNATGPLDHSRGPGIYENTVIGELCY